VLLQPSFELALPSSHCSRPTTIPSPHFFATQRALATGQTQPDSRTHFDVQPSPLCVLPSSHCSEPPSLPSPHFTVDTQALPGVVQAYPCSSWHAAVQPSPLCSVAVVTVFSDGEIDDAVAAVGRLGARHSGRRARPARLDVAGRVATVVRRHVAVVALLAGRQDRVAADLLRLLAGATGAVCALGAGKAWLDRAVRAATVAVGGVAVVARFTGVDLAVAADPLIHARLSRRRARVAGLDLTEAGAAVTGNGVAVVAALRQ